MVHPLKRAEPYGETRPWHTLSPMPASEARNGCSEARGGVKAMLRKDLADLTTR